MMELRSVPVLVVGDNIERRIKAVSSLEVDHRAEKEDDLATGRQMIDPVLKGS